jgi:hypothetical protein
MVNWTEENALEEADYQRGLEQDKELDRLESFLVAMAPFLVDVEFWLDCCDRRYGPEVPEYDIDELLDYFGGNDEDKRADQRIDSRPGKSAERNPDITKKRYRAVGQVSST